MGKYNYKDFPMYRGKFYNEAEEIGYELGYDYGQSSVGDYETGSEDEAMREAAWRAPMAKDYHPDLMDALGSAEGEFWFAQTGFDYGYLHGFLDAAVYGIDRYAEDEDEDE
jgi:hypothetical protein